ncbi:hydantoinase B/oxoprolinase family protein [Labrys monachus]|uniref:N-methylhydantoinase B n=1 Tax=Labrys monachus TaxID=217067 RepID=A0ABU0FF87_9HYPH|nr:hydantoinase B/oxoprolinase family protein [Labrys monachus]MDQ0392804.1 N-methylhydantoinase B [Labrys monachus]
MSSPASIGRDAPAAAALDAIAIELIRNSFHSICDEMFELVVRSSHSPNIKERRDCSCCLYAPSGEMVVQAEHIPIHLGTMPQALKAILAEYPAGTMQPGDAFLVNDPYFGGNHLPDLVIAGPMFLDGVLVGFAASMAHHTDVGGMTPRSMPASAVEIFQEGLRIPPVRLAEGGRINGDIMRLVALNSRLPAERRTDVQAQLSSLHIAQRRIDDMGRRYGAETLLAAQQALLSMGEAAMRMRIAALDDRRLTGASVADFGGDFIPIQVAIYKEAGSLVVDFEGTGAQTRSPFNSCLSNTYACVYMALRVVLGDDIPPSQGLYRPLILRVPEGSILNPAYPAAISAATQVSYHTFEALMRAFAPVRPDKVLADTGGGGVFSFGGLNPRSPGMFVYGEALGGGGGASATSDGDAGVIPPVANLHDTPVEVLETNIPVRIERYEPVEGSGGAGRHRGGAGLRRTFRMLAPVRCAFQISMPAKGPGGLQGGGSGRPTRAVVERADGTRSAVTRYTECDVAAGEAVTIETAGGGGFGSPSGSDSATGNAS